MLNNKRPALRRRAFLAFWGCAAFLLLASREASFCQWSEAELAAKITEKNEQIRKVSVEATALEDFLRDYEQNIAALDSAHEDLDRVRSKLATIQRNNLIKATIIMAITTWNECRNAADLARAGVEKILASGFVRGTLSLAYEKFRDDVLDGAQDAIVNDPVKQALGLDDETLNSPYTVKIGGVRGKALELLPELKKINQALNLSIEGAQAMAWSRDGLELGQVGALLYKNETIREELIPAAKVKLQALRAQMVDAVSGMESRLQWLQEEKQSLETMRANYFFQFQQVRQERLDTAGQSAANGVVAGVPAHAPITVGTPPPDNPPYPEQQPGETYEQYQQRVAAYNSAVAAIAAHRDLVAQEIRSQAYQIYTQKQQIEVEIAEILQARDARWSQVWGAFDTADDASKNFRGQQVIPDVAQDLSLYRLVELDNWLRSYEEACAAALQALADFVAWDEQIRQKAAQLVPLAKWQEALDALSASTQRSVSPYTYPVYAPHQSIKIAEPDIWWQMNCGAQIQNLATQRASDSAAFVERLKATVEGIPETLETLAATRAKIATAFPAAVALAQKALAETNENLANAEYAMNFGIAAAADYNRAVQDMETLIGREGGRFQYGYRDQEDYVSWTVVPVIRRSFYFGNYRIGLAAAVADENFPKARQIVAAYKEFCTQQATLQHRLHAANNHYFTYFGKISGQTPYGVYPAYGVFSDWRSASQIPDSTLQVPEPPDVDAMSRRFWKLWGYQLGGYTDYSNPQWWTFYNGLATLSALPDPGIDSSPVTGEELGDDGDHARTAYFEMLELREKWASMPWGSMGESAFIQAYAEEFTALHEVRDRMVVEDPSYADACFQSAQANLNSIFNQFSPQYAITQDLADQTINYGSPANFSVAISGGTPTLYRWYSRNWYSTPDDYDYFNLVSETETGSYTTPPLQSDRAFYVEVVTATGAAVRSRIARVTINPETLPPYIYWDLQPATFPAGFPVTLSVEFNPQAQCLVEWYKDGQLVQSGASSKLDLGLFDSTKAGTYRVRVINSNNAAAEGQPASLSLAAEGQKVDYTLWAFTRGKSPWEIYNKSEDSLGLGAPNLLCYALGAHDPASSRRLHPEPDVQGGRFAMRFKAPKYITGVRFVAETSSDLVNWSAAGVEMFKEREDAADEEWCARTTGNIAGRAFLRLRVEEIEP